MSAESSLYDVLRLDAGVAALVNSRIYPAPLPEDASLPAITYQRITTAREYHLAGPVGLVPVRMQINCIGASTTSALAVVATVLSVLRFYSGGGLAQTFVLDEYDRPDPDPKRHLRVLDVALWIEEA